MARQPWPIVTLVAACTLALVACSKQADTNPTAPGSPGTGNTAEVVRPAAPDGPPGGPSGIKGSLPHTGSSGGDAVAGTTGDGSAVTGSGTQVPGVGVNGGLGNGSVMGSSPSTNSTTAPIATPGGNGSSNSTPGSSVGNRP